MPGDVCIIGGGGFIGDALSRALRRSGHAVRIVDLDRRLARLPPAAPGETRHAVDWLDPASWRAWLDGADRLVHLAWSSHPAKSMQAMADDASQNIVRSIEVFRAATEGGLTSIVFASSGGTVYGNAPTTPTPENAPLAPVSAYGVSKLSVEHYLRLIVADTNTRGLSLRLSNPYGPYQFAGVPIGAIAHFVRRAEAGEQVSIYGDGSIVRDYLWIEDLAEAFVAALFCDGPSGTYNVGTGEGHSLNSLLSMIEVESGKAIIRKTLPARAFDVDRVVLDCSRFNEITGWRAKTPLAEGIRNMVAAART